MAEFSLAKMLIPSVDFITNAKIDEYFSYLCTHEK